MEWYYEAPENILKFSEAQYRASDPAVHLKGLKKGSQNPLSCCGCSKTINSDISNWRYIEFTASQLSKLFYSCPYFLFSLLSEKEQVVVIIATGADEDNSNRLMNCLQQSWVFGEDKKWNFEEFRNDNIPPGAN